MLPSTRYGCLGCTDSCKAVNFVSGSTVNALNMESSADSFIEGWDMEVGECATPDWEVVEGRVVGVAGHDMDAEEGDGGTIMIGRGVIDWDGCSCGCG